MCTVSMVMREWEKTLPDYWTAPATSPGIIPSPVPDRESQPFTLPKAATAEEIAALRLEVEELVKLLAAAKRFDEVTGQKDCEDADKVKFLRDVADALGVNLEEALG